MSKRTQSFSSIAVVSHPQLQEAAKVGQEIVAYITERGFQAVQALLFDAEFRQQVEAGVFDLLVALGGDGTMLRAGHLGGLKQVPILGINLGRFGFLMELRHDQWREAMDRLLTGDFWVESRMMLRAEQWRGGERLGSWEVLNEAVVSRGMIVRPVHLETSVDGRFLTTYVADGLIASTPTGSTAYALAVGGPILPPELRTILLVPVAPHLSIDRAIVLSEGSSVSITVHTTHQAVLSADGQPPIQLEDGDCVKARASDHSVQFVRFQDPGYFYRNLTPHMNQNPSTGNSR